MHKPHTRNHCQHFASFLKFIGPGRPDTAFRTFRTRTLILTKSSDEIINSAKIISQVIADDNIKLCRRKCTPSCGCLMCDHKLAAPAPSPLSSPQSATKRRHHDVLSSKFPCHQCSLWPLVFLPLGSHSIVIHLHSQPTPPSRPEPRVTVVTTCLRLFSASPQRAVHASMHAAQGHRRQGRRKLSSRRLSFLPSQPHLSQWPISDIYVPSIKTRSKHTG